MDIKLRKKHWTEWIAKRLSGNNEVDKETINFGLNNYANEHGSEILNLHGVSNCPNLTNIWNEAVFKQERNEHSLFVTNDCWGALRTLEKHGLCKINDY
jgi:hypothetical protein